ncbi:hypothetical protein ERW49_01450 [Aliivibrio finisterrensis]|uniref:Beta-ketoacyl synthase N-terminal domain-containing protein n=1 Tax=Aliivibrio finisterrensis TaxID=511998 RepID=A0A4Q5KRJ4_9GAMM|nr:MULTISPECIES: hypothetical protein [Aliivibrio]MDD9174710.1 hypothetical protein [Aliivibrio sp. S3TY1]MDD9191789.1 hypothetical protein [Aliivibrio sp. S2TY2]RYU48660.1 hypothetical protein ERW49_01450 [Aliivibrio finisterrensis]
MMYVHCTASVNIKQDQPIDVKAECKKVASSFVRRTDRFIQLGLLGVSGIKEQQTLDKNTALFMVSGQGNLSVFNRLCQQRYVEKMPPKPVDFINSLSNTAGFYIAKYLELESKNLNLAQQGFLVENALLLADANLKTKQEKCILLGGVDEKVDASNSPHDYLDLPLNTQLGEGSNWMLLSGEVEGAQASIEVATPQFNQQTLLAYLALLIPTTHVAFGQRVSSNFRSDVLERVSSKKFDCRTRYDFYETNSLYVLNRFINAKHNSLLFIDGFDDKYRVITLRLSF